MGSGHRRPAGAPPGAETAGRPDGFSAGSGAAGTGRGREAAAAQPAAAGAHGSEKRARQLYVPTDPQFQSIGTDYQRDIDARVAAEGRYPDLCKGVIDFKKVTYRSSVGDMDIPAYLFQPLQKRGAKGHAAMIWVHGGVHGNWGITMFPFVKEAVERGYVVIAPDYRGSTGYGEAHHQAIDYGGYEVDDTMSAAQYLKTLPHVDPDRVGMMGWSHGGYITLLSVFRDKHPIKAAAAIVPGDQPALPAVAARGRVPVGLRDAEADPGPAVREAATVHRALAALPRGQAAGAAARARRDQRRGRRTTTRTSMIVDALRSRKPDLAETKTYVNPAPWGASVGHSFSRRVDPKTLERVDSPEQIDSWNRTWMFFEWVLRPYEDRSKPAPPVRTR